MSIEQVREIFHGQEGELVSASDFDSPTIKSHTEAWKWNGTGNFSSVLISFTNGRVQLKSQYGLV